MKIGIFDSGIGGLLITHSVIQELPQFDYLYLGDSARVPYGTRSKQTITRFTIEAVKYLFERDCALVIVACNTASADALRVVQQTYLAEHYPNRRVLGVLIPAAESAVFRTSSGRIGVLATPATVSSGAFIREIAKLNPSTLVVQQAAPLLVPIVETGSTKFAPAIVDEYVRPLLESKVDTVILGCTHYPILRSTIQDALGDDIAIVDQNEVVPGALRDYLARHPEIASKLSAGRSRVFHVTDVTEQSKLLADQWFGHSVNLELVPMLG